jgi:hypothetical protein
VLQEHLINAVANYVEEPAEKVNQNDLQKQTAHYMPEVLRTSQTRPVDLLAYLFTCISASIHFNCLFNPRLTVRAK